jgi:hypothetical protein
VTTTIDFRPLTDALSPALTRQMVAIPRERSVSRLLIGLALLFLGLLAAIAGLGAIGAVLRNAAAGLALQTDAFAPAGISALGVLVFAAGVTVLRAWSKGPTRESMQPRLPAFAEANGLLFTELTADPEYPGVIFTLGQTVDRQCRDHISSQSGRFFDVGEFYSRFAIDSPIELGRSWGYIAIRLDRRLPHMMLKSRIENRQSLAVPADLAGEQTLPLEGDFNSWFTLYAPLEYERDALYFFTPDLMALFVEEAAPFDAEIVDDWLFVYSNSVFTALGPEGYERVFRIIDLVGDRAGKRSSHYSDARLGDRTANVVAAPGARLRRRAVLSAVQAMLILAGLVAVTLALFYVTSLLPGVRVS